MINLIWAQSLEGVIGKDNKLPWHLPEDLAHFKKCTEGKCVIMGRKTWDSLPDAHRPLFGRLNVVVSSSLDVAEPNVLVVPDLNASLEVARRVKEVWVIGGSSIYQQFLPIADSLTVTYVAGDYEGDAYAPDFDASWLPLKSISDMSTTGIPYRIVTYVKGKFQ